MSGIVWALLGAAISVALAGIGPPSVLVQPAVQKQTL